MTNPISPRQIFISALGRLPNTTGVLIVTVFAGLIEGVSLTLFIPLLEILKEDGQGKEISIPLVGKAIDAFDLPVSFWPLLMTIVIFATCAFALVFWQRRLLANARQLFAERIRNELYEKTIGANWDYLSKLANGEVTNDLTVQTAQAAAALQMQVLVLAAILQSGVLMAVNLVLSWELSLMAVTFAVVLALLARPLVSRAHRLGMVHTDNNRRYGFFVADYMRGKRQIKISGSETRTSETVDALSHNLYLSHRNLEYNSAALSFLLQAGPIVLMAAIIVVAHKVLATDLSVVLIFLLILARTAPRIAEIPMRFESFTGHAPALEIIDRELAQASAHAEEIGEGGSIPEKFDGVIELRGVSMVYPDADTPALDNICFTIPPTGMTAITGRSGAGKSSLIDLIVGLRQPTSGEILIDGNPLADMDRGFWRKQVGYVTQDVTIFNDTLINNLITSQPEATLEQIDKAIEAAGLSTFIKELPNGMETNLGENGVRLSGGQKQRLALARALLGEPSILFLDEATSALDGETERFVQDAINRLSRDLSVVAIAHRLTTIQGADMVHVLEKGKLVESGQYDELISRKGYLYFIHEAGQS